MVDISDDTKIVWRRAKVTGVLRRRGWSEEEKGRIVAEAIAPGAVIADVARRHDIVPQHVWNCIRAAREGRFALPGDGLPAFVPAVSVESGQVSEPAQDVRLLAIEVVAAVTVRVPADAEARDVEAVLRAVSLVDDSAPTATVLPRHDARHAITYLRLLDPEGADWQDVARIVLHIDPAREPERAHRAWESHLARAQWMAASGHSGARRSDWLDAPH